MPRPDGIPKPVEKFPGLFAPANPAVICMGH